ncbi:50S ribosomal protein L24 [Clostridia bacterium]|nr:50S ribosomal protein L24 [Clostridia bacterium]
MSKLQIKKGDEVLIISGRDKGKKGKVVGVSPSEGKVIVDGCNTVTKHIKPRAAGQAGQIVKADAAIFASKVMPVCRKCNKAVRPAHKFVEGKGGVMKQRVCRKCGAVL